MIKRIFCVGMFIVGSMSTTVLTPARTTTASLILPKKSEAVQSSQAAVAIYTGWTHTCAILTTSGVKCWGWNGYGSLGNNSTSDSHIPVDVSGLGNGAAAITAGVGHTCALLMSGGVKCWGWNGHGQLGNNLTTDSHIPVDVSGLGNVVTAISAGGMHTCALLASGGVKCWGYNEYGQLGNNSVTDSATPVDVTGLGSRVTSISAGAYHTCALLVTGGAKCWGMNGAGQLGNNSTNASNIPVDVSGLSSDVAAISAGGDFTCALLITGGVACWGDNSAGALGDNTTISSLIPVNVSGMSSGVAAIAAGEYGPCALLTSGGVKCWGLNEKGQLGNNSNAYSSSIPVDVSGLASGVAAISKGYDHSCALLANGGVKCWGWNRDGQLGNNLSTDSHIPVGVMGLEGAPYPVVASITRINLNPTKNASVDFAVTFSEIVTGVAASDFTLTTTGVSGAAIAGVTGFGGIYTVSVNTGSGIGTLRLDVTDNDSILDMALNPLGGTGAGNGNYSFGEVYTVVKTDAIWSTFLGGSLADSAGDIAIDKGGNIYVTGASTSSWGDPLRAYSGGNDAFVAKLDPSGALLWNTFLGSSGDDAGSAVVVDGSGNVYVTGLSFATWGSPLRLYNGQNDAFIAQLDSAGNLVWNTFLGSGDIDEGNGITLDKDGNLLVVGTSGYTWGNPVRAYNIGDFDAFAAKLSPSGALIWNTFLGGSNREYGGDVTVDSNGNVYVVGSGWWTNWGNPVRAYTSQIDAFAAKLTPDGVLVWNSFLGGNGWEYGRAVAVDGGGNVYVAGYSDASWGNPVRAYSGSGDAFAAKLDSSGNLTWNTFLGGSGYDYGQGIVVDHQGNSYIVAQSNSTWSNPLRDYTSSDDAVVDKLDASGNLSANTFLGGNGSDYGIDIVMDADENIYIAGSSDAAWGVPVRAYAGGADAFAARVNLSLAPTPLMITGKVSDTNGTLLSGVTILASTGVTVTTDASGYYTLTDIITGTYTITPTRSGTVFAPPTRTVSVPPIAANQDFTAYYSQVAQAISTGEVHSCALLTTGGVKCWGDNEDGQLGNNSHTSSAIPVGVSELVSGVESISAGGFRHTCALLSTGGVKCWGSNMYGQLGNDSITSSAIPIEVNGMTSNVLAISSASSDYTCALLISGGIKCWGYNTYGQLGNNSNAGSYFPVDVSGLVSGVTAISAGTYHACALLMYGGVKCWGANWYGGLGNNSTTSSAIPVDVSGMASGVAAISAGSGHTCALLINGGVKCWGSNAIGQLGNNSTADSYIPVDVSGLDSGVMAISAGESFTCALLTTGGVKCWGWNAYGELGNNTNTDSHIPVDVSGMKSGVVAIDAGGSHTCALLTNGSVKCWGFNRYGELGNNTFTNSLVPVGVFGLEGTPSSSLSMISGKVSDANINPVSGVTIVANSGISATTDASGYYSLTNLIAGTYTITPMLGGYTFSPQTRVVSVTSDVGGQDFTGRLPINLSLTPPTHIDAGSTVLVPVWVNNTLTSDGLRGVQIRLEIGNTAIVAPDTGAAVAPGDLMPSDSYTYTAALLNGYDYMAVESFSAQPITGSGVLVYLPVRGVSEGCTTLTFSEHILGDSNAALVAHTTTDAVICVLGKVNLTGAAYLQSRAGGHYTGTQVVLTGSRGVYTTTTDATGAYALTGIYSDTYTVRLTHGLFVGATRTVTATQQATTAADIGLWAGDVRGDGVVDQAGWYLCAAASIPVSDPAFDIKDDGATNVLDCIVLAGNIGRANMAMTNPPRAGQLMAAQGNGNAPATPSQAGSLYVVSLGNGDYAIRLRGTNLKMNALGLRLKLAAGSSASSVELRNSFAGGYLRWHQDGDRLYLVASPQGNGASLGDTEVALVHTDGGGVPVIEAQNSLGVAATKSVYLPLSLR